MILLHRGLDDLGFAATIILQRLVYSGSLWHSYRRLHCIPTEFILRSKAVAANCLLLFLKLRISFRKEKSGDFSSWRPLVAAPKMFTKRANNLALACSRFSSEISACTNNPSQFFCGVPGVGSIYGDLTGISPDREVRTEIWDYTNEEFLGKFLCSWNFWCLDCGMRGSD